ncbi:hypothetical protein [Amycolatopsis sp. CA-230715]|uniref:hypothetical protein n=1 Tax=Amycolatopsis sp. CA-230715 TaxID=2745196 RepID=UPI001C039F7E|nr:hypothetical protein [Amycolatopsis sp. CA-230715]
MKVYGTPAARREERLLHGAGRVVGHQQSFLTERKAIGRFEVAFPTHCRSRLFFIFCVVVGALWQVVIFSVHDQVMLAALWVGRIVS